jgi:hypothetical protein
MPFFGRKVFSLSSAKILDSYSAPSDLFGHGFSAVWIGKMRRKGNNG